MSPTFFPSPAKFRAWLDRNNKSKTELLVGFYKKDSGKQNMTWPQSVDEALCFGWIDGIRKSIDKDSYTIRFTPRKPNSNWSHVNIKKIKDLTEKGLMLPAGLDIYKKRKEEKSRTASYESPAKKLPAHLEKRFKADKKAWAYFTAQAPSYQKVMIHWIVTAKREATRLARLGKAMASSKEQKRVM